MNDLYTLPNGYKIHMNINPDQVEEDHYIEHIAIPSAVEDECTEAEIESICTSWMYPVERFLSYVHGVIMFTGNSGEFKEEMDFLRDVKLRGEL